MKTATTIEEQIALLKSRGMRIADEAKAREVLFDIGYYRLGFYWFPFEVQPPKRQPRTHQFLPGTEFGNAVRLYYFDRDLRTLVINATHRIELNFRTSLIYHASNLYKEDPTWFCNPAYVNDGFLLSLEDVYQPLRKNEIIFKHHKTHPGETYAPAWKTLEFLTMGQTIRLFEALKDDSLKDTIIERYGLRTRIFGQFINTIRILRNRCAHSTYIYSYRPGWAISNSSFLHFHGHNQDIVGCLMVVDHLLRAISPNRSRDFREEIRRIVEHPDNAGILSQTHHLKDFYA